MKKVFLLIIMLFCINNVYALDKYEGDYTIEYLLKNYNVITLGIKDKYGYSLFDNKENVSNIFDIGGPVLINGNYVGNDKFDNEFAQKNNNIKSYINGYVKNVKPGSKESHDKSTIYISKDSNINNKYNYNIVKNDSYLDFDKLYSSIVNEQGNIDDGKVLSISKEDKLANSEYSYTNNVIISKYGNYKINNINEISTISIKNYNPNELYIITSYEEFIYMFPLLEIDDIKNNYSNKSLNVYCGRLDKNELCTSNIIWNFPNARYIYTNYSTKGHIIAPKADIELVESNYQGSIISNSLSSKKGKYTSIEYYPYNLDKKIVTSNSKTCITEYKDNNDIYNGNYSIDELLKNYSVVTLGQKDYKNSKISKGSVSVFHIAGNFLINGNLGKKDIIYKKQNKDDYSGIKLDFKYTSDLYNSYIKGNLYSDAFDTTFRSKYTYDWQRAIGFTIKPYLFVGNNNNIIDWTDSYHTDLLHKQNIYYNNFSRVGYYKLYLGPKIINDKYSLETDHSSFNSDNYIDFKKLYDSIIKQQNNIDKGKKLNKDSKNIIKFSIGGNYNIDNINDIKLIDITDYNIDNNKTKLTIITINDKGTVKIPIFRTSTYNGTPTNSWYGKKEKSYKEEEIYKEVYSGNIVWNIPNASKVILPEGLPFKGHIIAPKADVETPEVQVAGCVIANSLYSKKYTDLNFYPLTVGSVGKGIKEEITTGNCEEEKITIEGSIKWDGKELDKVKVYLSANGKVVDSITVTKDNWNYIFKEKNRLDEYGRHITYNVTEEPFKDYEVTINNYNIINKYSKGNTFINVYNLYENNINPIKVRIYKGKTVELDSYAHTFNIKSNKKIKFDVEEIEGYKIKVSNKNNNYTITYKIKEDNKYNINISTRSIIMIFSIVTMLIVIGIVIYIKFRDRK